MKTKRIIVFLLALVMAFGLGGALVACGSEEQTEEETQLTIDSKTEDTIEVGGTYTLVYTSKGTVTVTVSGGTYNDDTHKFTAETEGVYTITVKAVEQGKKEAVKTVTITVVAGADRSALNDALARYNALIAGDYTSQTWSKARSAALAAEDLLEEEGVSQDEINEAAGDLNSAIDALVPAEITKAVTSEESIVWNGTTYLAVDYKNFEEILGKVNTLNADTTVKLRSEYTEKIEEIIAQFNAKLVLNLTGGLTRGGKMLVSALREYKIVAESAEGATFTWKVDGAAQSATGAELSFTPTEYGKDYTVECTATNGTESNTKSFTVSFEQVNYQNNMGDGITVTDDVIEVTKNDYGWGDQMGKKVTIPDLYLKGEFSVTFDLTFTEQGPGGTRCMALFLLNANGDQQGIWYAVVHQTPWLEVTFKDNEDAKIRKEMPSGTVDVGKVMHFSMNRVVKDGTAYLTADLLDDRGNVIFHNDGDNMTTNNDAVMLGIQIESMACKIENLAVKCGGLVNLTTLRAVVNENTGKYLEEDYTHNTYVTFQSMLQNANMVLESKSQATAGGVETAIKGIEGAVRNLSVAPLVQATVNGEDSFTYAEKTYSRENYENFDAILPEVTALNANAEIKLNSVYKAEILKIIEKLVPYVSVEITGIEERVYLAETLPQFVTLQAKTLEGAQIKWEVNGVQKGTLANLQFEPEFKDYTVKCTVTYNGKTSDDEVHFAFKQVTYRNNKPDGITIEDNVIKVTKSYDWGDPLGNKVVIDGLYVDDFDVYFDLKFTEHRGDANNANVMALFLLDTDGNTPGRNEDKRWFAVCEQNGWLEVTYSDNDADKVRKEMPQGAWAIGNTMHFRMSRYTENGATHLRAALLGDDGTELFVNDVTEKSTDSNIKMFGIQAEHVSFELSNITLSLETEIVDLGGLRAAISSASTIRDVEEDYTAETAEKFTKALATAKTELTNAGTTKSLVEKAIQDLTEAQAALSLQAVIKAEADRDTSITWNEKTYSKSEEYLNFPEIADEITALNARADINRKSDYRRAIEEILSRLVKEFILSGEEGNRILNTLDGFNFLYKATQLSGYTYQWKLDERVIENDGYEYELEHAFGEHTVEVTATKGEQVYSAKKSITLVQANFKVRSGDASKTHLNGNVFSSETGIGWGSWEGSNFLLDDLVFNGSFSIQANVTWKDWSSDHGAGQVLTFHILNADTLSPNNERDRAIVSYGAILLQESGDGQRLEAHDGGHRWKFEDSYGGKINIGDTFTIKLTAKKDLSNKYHVSFSLYNPTSGTWIDFAPSDVASGEMGNGMIVGMNIENSAFEVSGFSYELLSESGYLTGSVASKAALHNALTDYEEATREYYRYPNGVELLEAYQAAYGVFKDNSDSADYDGALEALEAAHTALGEKQTVEVTVEGLEGGANKVRGNTFTAKINGEASEIYWTYGEGQRAEGATLTLPTGKQTDITLHFTLGGQQYTYRYQDITVEALGLTTENGDKVAITDEKVTVTDGAGWGAQRQLVVDGLYTQEFVFSFDAKKLPGHEGDANSVVAIRTFEGGDDVTAVIGYSRDAAGRKMHIGYNAGTGYVDPFADDVRNSLWNDGAHIVLKQIQRADGAMVQTFSIYKADGTFVASQNSIDYIHHYDSGTSIFIGFENISLELTNIRICYLG